MESLLVPPVRLDHGVEVVGDATNTGVVSPPFAVVTAVILEASQFMSTVTMPLLVVVTVIESHLQPVLKIKYSVNVPPELAKIELTNVRLLSIVPVSVPAVLPFSVP